jgi:hypothetical protein
MKCALSFLTAQIIHARFSFKKQLVNRNYPEAKSDEGLAQAAKTVPGLNLVCRILYSYFLKSPGAFIFLL